MRRLVSMVKPEFHTVRQLEKKGQRLFVQALMLGCISLAVIFVLPFIPYAILVGVAGATTAAVMFLVGMGWISWLGKGPSKHVHCPYCSTTNEVFIPRDEFNCDMCGRLSRLTEHGIALPTEEQIIMKKY